MGLKFKPGDRVKYKWLKPGETEFRHNGTMMHEHTNWIDIELYGTVVGYNDRFEVIIKPDFVPVVYVKEECAEVDTIQTLKSVMGE